MSVHCDADDTQLYCPVTPGIDVFEVLSHVERCIEALCNWMHTDMRFQMHGLSDRLMHWQLVFYIYITRQYTKITEVNLSTFVYRLFHEYFSSIVRISLVVTQYEAICFFSCVNVSDITWRFLPTRRVILHMQYVPSSGEKSLRNSL